MVWGWENVVDTRAVDSRIVELRKALKDQTDEPLFIETIPQQGYRFIHPVKING
jgi:DNA-binding winged helix-turn-helix (wHTH) protein